MRFCERALNSSRIYPIYNRALSQNLIFSWFSFITHVTIQTHYPTLPSVFLSHFFPHPPDIFHVSHIKFCYTLQQTGVLFWSELGCIVTPCSRQDGLLRPRGATPEPPWRSDPCGVTGRTVVVIGTNKGSHLIMTGTLDGQAQSSGDETNLSVRRVGKMCSLNQLTV